MHKFLALATSATLLIGGIVATTANAADHREAIAVGETPAADLADVYAFRSPERSNRLALVMTVNPLSDPDFSSTYNFSPDVLYRFAISNDGGSRPEFNIDFLFSPVENGVQTFTAFTPVGRITGTTTPPGAAQPTINRQNGIRIFAGLRDDPFFFDNVGLSRVLQGGEFRGVDGFASFNVSAIVMDLPRRLIRGPGRNPNIEVTALTFTEAASSFQTDLSAPERRRGGRTFTQADRVGVPGLSSVLVPGELRNAFNYAPVRNGGDQFAGTDFTSVLVESLTAFGTPEETIGVLASVAVPDTLKINVNQPSGFPNGRLLSDDIVDTLLQLILDNPAAGDGVDANDVAFSDEFPFLAPPQQPE